MPISYKVLALFNVRQFDSVIVDPIEIPSICVCTAPATPTVHKSELELLILGDTAVGGGELTVVVESVVESIVLFVVFSVTIGSEIEAVAKRIISKVNIYLSIVILPFSQVHRLQ